MPSDIPTEVTLVIFAIMAVVFLALGFLIVLRVKSIPNKLLLLGLLMTVIAVGFGAFLPGMTAAAIIMLILAVICTFLGIICLLVSHITGIIKSGNETGPKP